MMSIWRLGSRTRFLLPNYIKRRCHTRIQGERAKTFKIWSTPTTKFTHPTWVPLIWVSTTPTSKGFGLLRPSTARRRASIASSFSSSSTTPFTTGATISQRTPQKCKDKLSTELLLICSQVWHITTFIGKTRSWLSSKGASSKATGSKVRLKIVRIWMLRSTLTYTRRPRSCILITIWLCYSRFTT